MLSVSPNLMTYSIDCGFKVIVTWDYQKPTFVTVENSSRIGFEFKFLKELGRTILDTQKQATIFTKTETESSIIICCYGKSIEISKEYKQELCQALFEINLHVLNIDNTVCYARKLQSQKKELTRLREIFERKNRELDALHFVWCDGGCNSGVHRWEGKKEDITEELVSQAEINVRRLRRWLENYKFRQLSGHKKDLYFKSFRHKLRRLLDKWYWDLRVK